MIKQVWEFRFKIKTDFFEDIEDYINVETDLWDKDEAKRKVIKEMRKLYGLEELSNDEILQLGNLEIVNNVERCDGCERQINTINDYKFYSIELNANKSTKIIDLCEDCFYEISEKIENTINEIKVRIKKVL